jgi:hypothetical protein
MVRLLRWRGRIPQAPCLPLAHQHALTARGSLANWTGEAGDAAGARDQFAALLPVRERVLGAEHPETLDARADLDHWTRKAGDGDTGAD